MGRKRNERKMKNREIRLTIKTRNTDPTGRSSGLDTILQHDTWNLLLSIASSCLITNSINTPIYHPTIKFQDLFDGVGIAEVDGDTTDLLSGCKAFGNGVYDVDLRSSTEGGAVGSLVTALARTH